ncbi:annexin B9-like [Venturia canescens]|uniref:annexin B9-like n=1 Tax=Venturia canescens TaxID=32260 RepID=UPI001C9C92FA|nr:annexin B9-like [Venturia canescens]XP_043269584.1 annexin B9-like [Venturia canescens]XP_043269585.1 annexin B9-like [Venturia canescens]XP_043269586.1 annexin B9-like [Venturia canescens]XP_043269587.1 annexin B9-like [Venturia canescens]
MSHQCKLSPTVVAYQDFNASADAQVLSKAMEGITTDKNAIIDVLANRTNLQRQEIVSQFKAIYKKDLLTNLILRSSGNFADLLVAMMTPLPQYYAKELHDQMCQAGTEESVLIEVLCTLPHEEILAVKQAYETMYGNSLEDDLLTDAFGNLKRLVVAVCCISRSEYLRYDLEGMVMRIRHLSEHEQDPAPYEPFYMPDIRFESEPLQIHEIFRKFHQRTGYSIEVAIDNGLPPDTRKGLLAVEKCVKDRPGFFAEKLYESAKYEIAQPLTRLIVTRSEIDLGEIKRAFLHEYCERLESLIADKYSGNYRNCILAIVSSEPKI